jgi:dTDP-4-dehydrorhamnose reductase
MLNKPVYAMFGLGGAIGNALYERLSGKTEDYRVFAFDHSRVDITRESHVGPVLDFVRPTVVFNAAGISDPEMCEEAAEGAFKVNAHGAAVVAKACAKIKAKLVHFSTWAVFDGALRGRSYVETDKPAPRCAYGASKYEGELEVAKALPDALIVRSGWLMSDGEECIPFEWVANAERMLKAKVRDDFLGSPVYADDLVGAAMSLIDAGARGVFHVANKGSCSYRDLAATALDACKLPKDLVEAMGDGNFKADLPRCSSMDCYKYEKLTGKQMRAWPLSLHECLFHMGKYKPEADGLGKNPDSNPCQ